jgi:hypothetical protein
VTHTKSGIVGAAPFFEVPLPEGVWIALGGDFNFTYPEFERGGRFGYRKGYLGLAGKYQTFTYKTEVGYTEVLDSRTEPTTAKVNGKIEGILALPAKLELTGAINHTQFDYLDEELEVPGPDSSSSFTAGATQGLPFGFSIGLEGSYEYQSNNVIYGIPSFGQIAADGQVATGKATLDAVPFPWLAAGIEEIFTKTTWKQDNEAAKDAFEANVVNYMEQLTAYASINMAF